MSGFKRLKQEGLLGRFVVAVLVVWLIGVATGIALVLGTT